jgi:hypothetical protein
MHLMIAADPFFAFPSFETLRFATLLRMRRKSELRHQKIHALRMTASLEVCGPAGIDYRDGPRPVVTVGAASGPFTLITKSDRV